MMTFMLVLGFSALSYYLGVWRGMNVVGYSLSEGLKQAHVLKLHKAGKCPCLLCNPDA